LRASAEVVNSPSQVRAPVRVRASGDIPRRKSRWGACYANGISVIDLMPSESADNRRLPRRDIETPLGGFDVRMNRVLTDAEDDANLPIGLALASEFETLALARAERRYGGVPLRHLHDPSRRFEQVTRHELNGEIAVRMM